MDTLKEEADIIEKEILSPSLNDIYNYLTHEYEQSTLPHKDTHNMATQANAKTPHTLDIVDDVDSIPEEHIVNTTNGSGESGGTILSIDALNGLTPLNRQRDELERQKLNPPSGDWVKDTRWEMNEPMIYDQDSEPGDVNPQGRTMLSFKGTCQPRVVNGIEYCPTFFLRISPDKRLSKNSDQAVDLAYKLWLKVEELYLSLHGAQWTTGKQLFTMLMEDTFIVNTGKGDNNPIYGIKPVSKKR